MNTDWIVGWTATPEQVLELVRNYVEAHKVELSKTEWSGLGKTLGLIRVSDTLRWANALDVKTAAEQVYLETFGPKVAGGKAAANAKAAKVRFFPSRLLALMSFDRNRIKLPKSKLSVVLKR